MVSKFNKIIINEYKKNYKNMQEYSFTNFMHRDLQVKKQHGEFNKGEVLRLNDYITHKDEGYLVTSDASRRRIKESDIKNILVPYNPSNPAVPLFETPNVAITTPDPYGKPQKEGFVLDDNANKPPGINLGKVGVPVPVSAQKPKMDIFSVFENEPTSISIEVVVDLPKMIFIKEMYSNATDKSSFLDDLASHVKTQITDIAVKDSVKSLVEKITYKRKKNKSDEDTKS